MPRTTYARQIHSWRRTVSSTVARKVVAVPVRAEEREAGDAARHHVVNPGGRLRSETTFHPSTVRPGAGRARARASFGTAS